MAASSIKCSTSFTLVHVQDGTGVTISETSVLYALSSSGTTTPSDSEWKEKELITPEQGKYLWTWTHVKYSDGSATDSFSTAYIGTNGKNGDPGANGKSIVVAPLSYTNGYYANYTEAYIQSQINNKSNDSYGCSSTTGIEVGDIALCKNKVKDSGRITYVMLEVTSVSSSSVSGKVIGQTTGANGAAGKGISSMTTSSSSADGGTNTVTITYTDGNHDSFTVLNGNKGDTGAQGYSIVASVTRNSFTDSQWATYGAIGHAEEWGSTSSTRNGCRIGDLFTIVGTSTDGGKAYTLTYKSTTDSGNLKGTCISCVYSAKGATGSDGKGISSITYKYAVSSTQTQPSSFTLTSIPTLNANDKKYLWQQQTINYTTGNPTTTVTLIGVYGDKGDRGVTGAYTLFQYAVNNSATVAPTSWKDTMPAITTANPYLWIRQQKVAAGGTESDSNWSAGTLVGTDSSEVYVRIGANETNISEITKTGGLIESAITAYDENGETKVRSAIQQNADTIALKVGLNEDGSKLVVGEKTILLDAPNVIAPGTITANEINADILQGKKFVLTNGGAIESANYVPYGVTEGKGFRIDGDSGSAEMNNITLGGNAVVKGIVDNGVLKTVKTATVGETYMNPAWPTSGYYWRGEEAYNALNNYSGSENCTVVIKGKSYAGEIVVKSSYFSVGESYFVTSTTSTGLPSVKRRWTSYASVSLNDYNSWADNTFTVTLSDGTMAFNSEKLTKYAYFPGTGASATVIGEISSGTFKGIDVAGKTATVTADSVVVNDVGKISTSEAYTESTWATYSLTFISENVGVYGSDFLPMKNEESDIGSPNQKFDTIYANNLGSTTQKFKAIYADNFFPIGAIYMSVEPTSPASLFGGEWEALEEGHTLWSTAWTASTTASLKDENAIPAGLPNIKGYLNYVYRSCDQTLQETGAISSSSEVDAWYKNGTNNKFVSVRNITFNASGSNSIYGNSSTVQPPAYKVYIWKRLS